MIDIKGYLLSSWGGFVGICEHIKLFIYSKRANKMQAKCIKRLMRKNKTTVYGELNNFKDVKTVEDLFPYFDILKELGEAITDTALCGLGKSAALPVLSTLRLFHDEYVEHVVDKKCRTGNCQALRTYKIDPEKCKGCSKCARNCPVGAISGVIKNPYTIDGLKCIKCGACESACPFGAITIE